jgi:hypothetical protein
LELSTIDSIKIKGCSVRISAMLFPLSLWFIFTISIYAMEPMSVKSEQILTEFKILIEQENHTELIARLNRGWKNNYSLCFDEIVFKLLAFAGEKKKVVASDIIIKKFDQTDARNDSLWEFEAEPFLQKAIEAGNADQAAIFLCLHTRLLPNDRFIDGKSEYPQEAYLPVVESLELTVQQKADLLKNAHVVYVLKKQCHELEQQQLQVATAQASAPTQPVSHTVYNVHVPPPLTFFDTLNGMINRHRPIVFVGVAAVVLLSKLLYDYVMLRDITRIIEKSYWVGWIPSFSWHLTTVDSKKIPQEHPEVITEVEQTIYGNYLAMRSADNKNKLIQAFFKDITQDIKYLDYYCKRAQLIRTCKLGFLFSITEASLQYALQAKEHLIWLKEVMRAWVINKNIVLRCRT